MISLILYILVSAIVHLMMLFEDNLDLLYESYSERVNKLTNRIAESSLRAPLAYVLYTIIFVATNTMSLVLIAPWLVLRVIENITIHLRLVALIKTILFKDKG